MCNRPFEGASCTPPLCPVVVATNDTSGAARAALQRPGSAQRVRVTWSNSERPRAVGQPSQSPGKRTRPKHW
eukprot:3098475-Pleurochrysis_carterae.AAC.1